jgi:GNAT superfamily N-acetyltransferase
VAERDEDRGATSLSGPIPSGSASVSRNFPIRVRLARPDDRDAVLAFATSTWNGWDYIPEVWDAWVVPTDGVLLVATVQPPLSEDEPRDADGAPIAVGQPIAMTRVAMLSEKEAWVEGIRVDPRVRGMNVATDLQVAALRWVAAHGARVVRYVTGEVNVASQRLGARHGLLEIGRWRTYRQADHEHDPSRTHVIPTEAALSLIGKARRSDWPRIRDDATLAVGHGLYEYRPWALQELTEERFMRHVDHDEVLIATAGEAWAAMILSRRSLADRELHVALAAGDGNVLLDGLLLPLGRPDIRVPDPDPPLLHGTAERFIASGYVAWAQGTVLVERPVDDAHPLPEPDEPGAVVFGDEPRRIAVPPTLGA